MILMQMNNYSKYLISQAVCLGDTVVDATAGNGNDTLYLANLVGATGRVYSFDIQAQAIENTAALLAKHDNVTLIHDGHQNVDVRCMSTLALEEVGRPNQDKTSR